MLTGYCSFKNKRPVNEDQVVSNNCIIAVFDGHGGIDVSEALYDHFDQQLKSNKIQLDAKHVIAELQDVEDELQEDSMLSKMTIGSTASIVSVCGDVVSAINIGDSSQIVKLKHEPFFFTNPLHRVNESETLRLAAYNTVPKNGKIDSNLSVTRAIGDFPYKSFGVVSDPEIREFPLQNVSYALVCSDGLTDVLSVQQILQIVDHLLPLPFSTSAPTINTQTSSQQLSQLQSAQVNNILQAAEFLFENKYSEAKTVLGSNNNALAPENELNGTKEDAICWALCCLAQIVGTGDNCSVAIGVMK
ncbi:Phosphatase [Hexamita inflata]|uniref:Phosphatase n=1 Tax=Hexamita inflata TaxID=28002 RepID=A0AA86U0B2_9EUKA|nr:Phosphatase [Hexamita inflata]